MSIKIYHVDAFCRDLFSGNPAAVCPLQTWPDDALMQQIAAENMLPATAFYAKVAGEPHYLVRWFSPKKEIELCGHGTLAAAHVLFNHENHKDNTIAFLTKKSGGLTVTKQGDTIELDFPADTLTPATITGQMQTWFADAQPLEAYKGRSDYFLVFKDEATVANAQPNLEAIAKADAPRGVIITALGNDVDFVSRFFAPKSGIGEDPVTGSAHTTLTPYWSKKLDKRTLTAMQLSARKGYLQCEDRGPRTTIRGIARTYMTGQLLLPE
jgi:PhzF family phenazine biosynthesis protein